MVAVLCVKVVMGCDILFLWEELFEVVEMTAFVVLAVECVEFEGLWNSFFLYWKGFSSFL